MAVVSEPCKEIVGGGSSAKYIKECKELYLSNKGIEKLRGFEPFVNLESLWLNGNKLRKVNNLDANFRIKALYCHVQDNQICTLRGSLLCFKFLETLDLSNNQLRDLDKLLQVLSKFKFLHNLNLQGNPCVEEPDYRLTMIHRMPNLHVLDHHVVTDAERHKAAARIGGDVQSLTVAFMQRVPPYNPAWDAKVSERSVLEQLMVKEAATIRDTKAAKTFEAEMALFKHNPHPDIPRGQTLPPNAGTRHAQHMSMDRDSTAPKARGGLARPIMPFHRAPLSMMASTVLGEEFDKGLRQSHSIFSRPSVKTLSTMFSHCPTDYTLDTLGSRRKPDEPSPHVPKDVLNVYRCRPSSSELQKGGTRMYMLPPGNIRFEQQKYDAFVKQRTCGREKWGLDKSTVII